MFIDFIIRILEIVTQAISKFFQIYIKVSYL